MARSPKQEPHLFCDILFDSICMCVEALPCPKADKKEGEPLLEGVGGIESARTQ